MQTCIAHTNKLKAALVELGLGAYINDVNSRITRGGEIEPDAFLAANYAITLNALGRGNAFMLVPKDDGTPCCPLCFLIEWTRQPDACSCDDPACTPDARAAAHEAWIQHAAREQQARFAQASH